MSSESWKREAFPRRRKTYSVPPCCYFCGFPDRHSQCAFMNIENRLSTWESKLRDELKLRKRAKTTDWPLIYRHVLPRLEHPKKKKPKRPTAVYINSTQVEWEKVWKEMRRYGALVRCVDLRSRTRHAHPRNPR